MSEPGSITRGAIFSRCGKWRYSLTRTWDKSKLRALFLMLNPSKAGEEIDDPTTVQCVKRIITLGLYGIYEACNLFALVDTDPTGLRVVDDPIGPHAVQRADLIVVAWGNDGGYLGRAAYVLSEILAGRELYCLGRNKNGTPHFPLRVPYSQPFVRYDHDHSPC